MYDIVGQHHPTRRLWRASLLIAVDRASRSDCPSMAFGHGSRLRLPPAIVPGRDEHGEDAALVDGEVCQAVKMIFDLSLQRFRPAVIHPAYIPRTPTLDRSDDLARRTSGLRSRFRTSMPWIFQANNEAELGRGPMPTIPRTVAFQSAAQKSSESFPSNTGENWWLMLGSKQRRQCRRFCGLSGSKRY
jgi:hypothetical protein